MAEPDSQTSPKIDDDISAPEAKPKLRRFSPAGRSILRKSLRTSYAKSKVKIQEQLNKVKESPSKLQNNNADMSSLPPEETETVQEGPGSMSTATLSASDPQEAEQVGMNPNTAAASVQSDARFVIETTLRKSAGVLSNFTENTISKSGTNFTSLLQTEKFGIPSNAAMKKTRPWCDSTPSVQCSVSVAHRKKPDLSKLPRNIVELLKQDSSLHSVISTRGGRPTQKRYHSKKMALKQQCSDDTSSSKMDLPVTRIKSTSSGESRAPKIVVVSGPLKLDSVDNQQGTSVKTAAENVESRTMHNTPYRRLNHLPIIQSIKDAIEKVHHNSNKLPKGQNDERGSGSNAAKKVNLGVDKGAAFVLGPKTKHPYYNTFGGVKDTKWLKESPSNCKWVINIGNFHDNEISFSLVDDSLTITGFRQPSLKYPEGQTVSETITIPPGLEVNNLRIYRSNNANELLVLEEVVPPPPSSQPQQQDPNNPTTN